MCLMLYLATSDDQPLQSGPDLSIEALDRAADAVRQWLSLPTVRFVGAHTGCSCGFPSIVAETPIDYFDGMFKGVEHRDSDIRSLRLLLELVRAHVETTGEVELYPVWYDEWSVQPRGTIDVHLGGIDPDTFFFHERFVHRVTK